MTRQFVATVAGAVALTIVQAATSLLVAPPAWLDAVAAPGIGVAGWVLVSNLLIAGTLAWFARRASWTGWPLAAALFAIAWGIGSFNALIEAEFFGFFPRSGELWALLAGLAVPMAILAPIIVWLSGRWREPGGASDALSRSTASLIARFAAACVAYLVLYFVAGMIIYPWVQAFYEQRPLPSTLEIATFQLLVRGPIFVALGWLLVRVVPATRAGYALLVAVAMAVLGGVAPLIVPNPYFTDAVRWIHFGEVVTSNLVFGAITGWLLGGNQGSGATPPGRRALE